MLHLLQGLKIGVHSFPLEYIKDLTYNFHDEYLIGKGGYGNVYKGKNDESFPSGKEVAIKRLNMEFLNDVRETREKQKD